MILLSNRQKEEKEKYLKELLKIPGLTQKHIEDKMEKLRMKFKNPVSEAGLLYILYADMKKKGYIK